MRDYIIIELLLLVVLLLLLGVSFAETPDVKLYLMSSPTQVNKKTCSLIHMTIKTTDKILTSDNYIVCQDKDKSLVIKELNLIEANVP